MRIPKGGTPLSPAKVRAEGEHTEFNKTTEAQSLQRKATPFYEKKMRNFNLKEENKSIITIHLTHVKI
jgi:hypothetical protein